VELNESEALPGTTEFLVFLLVNHGSLLCVSIFTYAICVKVSKIDNILLGTELALLHEFGKLILRYLFSLATNA
jgi:hypothetical protein